MVIYLDNIIFDRQNNGGISVVWYELLNRIINRSVETFFIDNENRNNNFRRLLDIPSDSKKDKYGKLSWFLPVSVDARDHFLFHSSYYRYCTNKKAINITTVHDFTYDYYRKGLPKWLHCWQRNRAIRHSEYIVCISENTKNDLLHFLPDLDERKVRVIYNGVSEDYYVINKEPTDYSLPFDSGSYLVFVGSRAGYKNFDLVRNVMAKTKYNLIIVGSRPSKKEEAELKKYIPFERYKATGFLPNEQLNVVYNNAAALVYPSSYEGFGIPVIEAQRAGCPVIAYKGSSIPEIIGETPLLMNELTEEELLKKIKLLSDARLIGEIRSSGLENSKRFSWDKMVQQYFDLYNEAFLMKQSNLSENDRSLKI